MDQTLRQSELITREIMVEYQKEIADGSMTVSNLVALVKARHTKYKHRHPRTSTIQNAILRFGPCGEDSIWARLPAPLPPYEVREQRGLA